MSGAYDNKARVQSTSQRRTINSTALVPVNSGCAVNLRGEMEDFERLIGERIGKLKAAVTEREAAVAIGTEQAEQLVEGLKASTAQLEATLAETRETVVQNDAERRQMEESLTAKITALQHDLSSKDEALSRRNDEINDLKSDIERGKEQIEALEFNLNKTEEILRAKEATIKGLELELAAKIEEFQGVLNIKGELLAGQVAEINDLKSQVKVLTKGIGQMSSFFRQAEAFVGVDQEAVGAAGLDKPASESLESPIKTQSNGTNDTPAVSARRGETVPADFFQPITMELADITGVMAPLAALIVKDHVTALNESMEQFPKKRLQELFASLAKEFPMKNGRTIHSAT